jgi:hypothetical protein
MRQLRVNVALIVDEDMTGKRGADNLHFALEAACAAAAESFMRTHNGVESWVSSRESEDGPSEQAISEEDE